MAEFTGAPALADTQDILKGAYAARIQEFSEAGRLAGFTPAAEDKERIALVLVDYQHDFVDPTGTLSVPGAQDDVVRLLSWFYSHAQQITSVYASLDTHLPFQIFFNDWWQDPQIGEHPQPFTAINADDVTSRRWVPLFHKEWSEQYVYRLAQQARKDLMIWPYHTMQGTQGQMLVAPLSEAIAWHSAARQVQPHLIVKGLTTRTEFYGIFGAEVVDPADPTSKLNTTLLDAVLKHDRVYIAGEAKSHCVLETQRQLVNHIGQHPELLQRLYFLTDCASSILHPAIDFEALTSQELASMQALGAHLVTSEDAL